jgi:hypothetical protein
MVMLVYSQTSVKLLNGMMTFSDTRKANISRDALFRVQHLDIGTAVSVDLSHVRLYLWSLTICAQNSPQSTRENPASTRQTTSRVWKSCWILSKQEYHVRAMPSSLRYLFT